jgi:threonine dehydratase
VHPFDDPEVIAGQGTVGMELLRQHPRPIHAVFCCGRRRRVDFRVWRPTSRPCVRKPAIIGVEAVDADAMTQSLAGRRRVTADQVGLFADGAAVKYVGEETFRLLPASTSTRWCWSIPTRSARRSRMCSRTPARCWNRPVRWRLPAPRRTQPRFVLSRPDAGARWRAGANVNFDRLRFVAERAEIGEAARGGARRSRCRSSRAASYKKFLSC